MGSASFRDAPARIWPVPLTNPIQGKSQYISGVIPDTGFVAFLVSFSFIPLVPQRAVGRDGPSNSVGRAVPAAPGGANRQSPVRLYRNISRSPLVSNLTDQPRLHPCGR